MRQSQGKWNGGCEMAGINTISETELRKLLQTDKIDVGNGTLFGVREKREVDRGRLKLIISTGGSGKTAITAALQTAKQTLKAEYENYVQFLVVDSSDKEVSAMAKKGMMTLPTSTPGAIKRMDYDHRPAFFRRFMPKNFPVSEIGGDGSGQKRMMGKMKFYDMDRQSTTTNDELLCSMIGSLFKSGGRWYAAKSQPVDIMILSGLSGGNGSGTFIDLAARARKACLDAGAKEVRVYGYLMLPDTAEQWAADALSRQSLYANGFAALKELEHYMCVGKMFHDSSEVIEAPSSSSSVTIDATMPLYNFPILISGSYENATSLIGETIVNLMAATDGNFGQEEFYSNRDTERNNALSVNNVSEGGVIKPDYYPEDSHMYCGIGYSSATIPEKIVIPNIIGKVSGKLFLPDNAEELPPEARGKKFCDKDHRMTRVEYERAMRTLLGIRPDAAVKDQTLWMIIFGNFKQRCALEPNTADIKYDEASTGDVKVFREGFHETKKAAVASAEMEKYFEGLYTRFCAQAKNVMEEFGPRAMWYLWTGAGIVSDDGTEEDYSEISLSHMIQVAEKALNSIAGHRGNLPDPLPPKGLLGRAWEAISKKKLAEYKLQFASAIQQNVHQEVASRVIGTGGILKNNFSNALEDYISVCRRFADVLETLKDTYQGAGRSLDMDSFRMFMEASEREGNTVNLCRDENMYEWVRDCANAKVYNVKTTQVKAALINDFVANSGDWASAGPGVARKRFDEVMSQVCGLGTYAEVGNGLKLSISDYFDKILEGTSDPKAQQMLIDQEAGRIVSLLKGHSAPSIQLQDHVKPTTNTILMVPHDLIAGKNGGAIQQAFNLGLSGAASAGGVKPQDQVVVSHALMNSIVCYQTCVAVPVSGLKDLHKWELEGYEHDSRDTTHLNCGEYETKYTELTKTQKDERDNIRETSPLDPKMDQIFGVGLSWRHYPSINLKDYQDEFASGKTLLGESTCESQYRSGIFYQRIMYALKEGIIECRNVAGGVRYVLNTIPQDWENLSLSGYPVDPAAGKMERGENLFRFLRDQNPGGDQDFQKAIVLEDSPFFGQPFHLTEKAKVSHWTDEKIVQTHRAYMMRIMRKNVFLYQELEQTLYRYAELVSQMQEEEKKYADLIHARLFCEFYLNGVIVRSKSASGTEWKAMINERGGNQRIVLVDQFYQITMDDLNKGFVSDKMDMPIVFREFSRLVKEGKFDLDQMSELKNVFLTRLHDQGKDLGEVLRPRIERTERNLEQYQSVYKGIPDPASEMLERYKVPASMREEAEKIVKFFAGLQVAILPYLNPAEEDEDDDSLF